MYFHLVIFWPTDISVEAVVIIRTFVCLSGTTLNCGQTAGWIELIFGTDLPLPKRRHVLGGEIRGLKFWVVWEGKGQLQAIETILCIVTLLDPETLC